jgi:hypothetical protein
MRVNVYAEEMTDRIEIITKEIDGQRFTGLRFYLELPVALATPPAKLGEQPGIAHISGPFLHRQGDDDSSAVTFWGKQDLRRVLLQALDKLDRYYDRASQATAHGLTSAADSRAPQPQKDVKP